MTIKRLIITPGEPAGIGPDVAIQAAQNDWPASIIAITDPALISDRAAQLNLPIAIKEVDLNNHAHQPHQAGTLLISPIPTNQPVKPGILNPSNAAFVVSSLQRAADACLHGFADGIVTGPVQKSVINAADVPFSGHTEFFADASNVKQTVMLFVVDDIKVALATTHLPLQQVPFAITAEKIISVIEVLHHDLQNRFAISNPHILVTGLNPHAGEDGHLGREEIDTIIPTLHALRNQGMSIEGPLPADTAFLPEKLKQADAVLAMYHDQALPVVKYMGFDRAVNVTLGLPFIRTSVDHGTALDIAGSGKANDGSMCAALKLGIRLTA